MRNWSTIYERWSVAAAVSGTSNYIRTVPLRKGNCCKCIRITFDFLLFRLLYIIICNVKSKRYNVGLFDHIRVLHFLNLHYTIKIIIIIIIVSFIRIIELFIKLKYISIQIFSFYVLLITHIYNTSQVYWIMLNYFNLF